MTPHTKQSDDVEKFLVSSSAKAALAKMPVEVSHKLDLELDLPDKYKDVALKQGEDPNKVPAHLDELRKIIFGK